MLFFSFHDDEQHGHGNDDKHINQYDRQAPDPQVAMVSFHQQPVVTVSGDMPFGYITSSQLYFIPSHRT